MSLYRRRKQNAEAARRYRERKRGQQLLEFETSPRKADERTCQHCRQYPANPQIGFCGLCWTGFKECRQCRRKILDGKHESRQGLCGPCWSCTPMYFQKLADEQAQKRAEPEEESEDLPIKPAPFDARQAAEVEAQAGGCPLPEFNVFRAEREAATAQAGTWSHNDGAKWGDGPSEREQLEKQIERDRRRKAGSQEF